MDKNQKDILSFFLIGLILILVIVFLLFRPQNTNPERDVLGSPFTDIESREKLYEHFEYEVVESNVDKVGDFERDLVKIDVEGSTITFKTSLRGFDLQDRMAFVGEIEIIEPVELNAVFNEKFTDTLFSLDELQEKLSELTD